MTTSEPSTYQQPESREWPVHAIPERWVEALFTAMAATYGARFADLWRGAKIDDVKRQWGVELARLTSAQMKAGRETMTDLERPPTLPEFMAHCRRARLEAVATQAPQLEHNPSFTPEKAEEGMRKIHSATARVVRKVLTAEWAFKLLMRGKTDSGKPIPFEVVKCASDAISSPAGKQAVDECPNPDLKAEYATIRQHIVDDYRARGKPLWGNK
jgi:hypothetical protein